MNFVNEQFVDSALGVFFIIMAVVLYSGLLVFHIQTYRKKKGK